MAHAADEGARVDDEVRVGEPEGNTAKATANIDLTVNITGSTDTIFTLEALGDGPQFNNFVGTGSEMGTDNLLPRRTTSATNDQLLSGSYGGRGDNFRFEISSRNLAKGTFTLALRQGNDTIKKKLVLETHENLSLDPKSSDYILKRIGNQTSTVVVEDCLAFVRPS